MDDDGPTVVFRRTDRVFIVVLNRPTAGNALSPEMISSLGTRFEAINSDRSVRAVLLRGEGAHFCSGGGVRDFQSLLGLSVDDRRAVFAERMAVANAMILAFAQIEAPVIIACRGAVAGGGLSFALAADVVLADATAQFMFSHQRVGLPPDGGVSAMLPGVVGHRRARELVLTAATVDAAQALQMGIVSRLVDAECLEEEAMVQAQLLARGPADAARAAKRLLQFGSAGELLAQLNAERDAIVEAVGTADFEEGVRAFLERRNPIFRSAFSS